MSKAHDEAVKDLEWAFEQLSGYTVNQIGSSLVAPLLQQLNFHRMMEANFFVESIGVHGEGCVDLRMGAVTEEGEPAKPVHALCTKCGVKEAVVGGYCVLCDVEALGNSFCLDCEGFGVLTGSNKLCQTCGGTGEVVNPDAPHCVMCGSTDVTGDPPMCPTCAAKKSGSDNA